MKSPINYVGNKYKHMEVINNIFAERESNYNKVIDVFMGSGNVLLNIDIRANEYIGNDKVKLIPNLYQELVKNNYTYDKNDIEEILNKWNRFGTKDSYYGFRDYWNRKYLSDNFDRKFIMETVLLLKMCSNSMVRFNPKEGYFNQGFRGLGDKKEFFTDTSKIKILKELEELSKELNNRNYKFTNKKFGTDYIIEGEDNLLILDPPYLLRHDMYSMDWTIAEENKLIELLKTTKDDFIYFNYMIRDGEINEELKKLVKEMNFKIIDINDKTLSGQGRSENIREVKEVIITNV